MAKPTAPISKPIRVLFIGNSFTNRNDMPGTLERLAANSTPSRMLQTQRIIANGMSLRAHLNKGEAKKAVDEGNWSYVVLQEQSTLPLKNRQRMHESITQFDEAIRAAGARTILYLTWARRLEFERQTELTDAYQTIGKKLNCLIAPVGIAWQTALADNPDLILHDKDNSHPNPAGSYLAACVFQAILFPKSKPKPISPLPSGISPELAEKLQAKAVEVTGERAVEP